MQHYIDRCRAFNGVASLLVTADGAPVPPAPGALRGGQAIAFPTETVRGSDVLPDLDRYVGPPLEWGRMEPTASDGSVQQQYGMIVGKRDAGQVNALATLNIRGERSVTCKGDFDRHPAHGPLPPDAPPVCEMFRHLSGRTGARGGARYAAYGRSPDLGRDCRCMAWWSRSRIPFDTKDMRSTGGGDAALRFRRAGPRPHPGGAVAR